MTEEWYVWTIRPGKFDIVSRYIEKKIPQVKKILYPTVTTEKMTKKGIKEKKSPLYAAYVFLQYAHNLENPLTWNMLNKHHFITGYVGPCTPQDLATVNSLQKTKGVKHEKVDVFTVGCTVRVCSGVFLNYVGRVSKVTSNSVGVVVERAGKTLKVVFSPEDLEIIGAALEST